MNPLGCFIWLRFAVDQLQLNGEQQQQHPTVQQVSVGGEHPRLQPELGPGPDVVEAVAAAERQKVDLRFGKSERRSHLLERDSVRKLTLFGTASTASPIKQGTVVIGRNVFLLASISFS